MDMWRKPLAYLNDSIDILNAILEQIKSTSWPTKYTDEALQLQQYILEMKMLVIQNARNSQPGLLYSR
jgi:hypothetical protein